MDLKQEDIIKVFADEEWRIILGGNGWQASSNGRVRDVAGSVRTLRLNEKGYPVVWMYYVGKHKWVKVHQLVALAFIENPENKPMVNHKDGDKANNTRENLEWCTAKENVQHAWEAGLNKAHPENSHKPVYVFNSQGTLINCYPSLKAVQESLGYSQPRISAAIIRKGFIDGMLFSLTAEPPKPTAHAIRYSNGKNSKP